MLPEMRPPEKNKGVQRMKRAYNFNAGPSAMPLEVLKEAQAEFLDFQGTGMETV